MTDLTPIFSDLLKSHNARLAKPSLSLQNVDEFLKEAYRINAAIASLTSYLHTIRQPYLSTAPPPRRNRLSSQDQFKYLTDRQREEIDAQTKQLLRELNASIRNLADAEQIRQNTQTAIARKKYARLGLGALGSWAAGGAGQTKSYEQEQEEAKALAISTHRESVLWYLRRKLQECGGFQASMMEKRIRREMERNRSVLEKSEFGPMHDYGYDSAAGSGSLGHQTTKMGHAEAPLFVPEEELTPQQIQMFEKQNQDMLKQYESTLNQVSKAEKSLLEISELQTQLVNNLATQSAHIDQLVADSEYTAENVGGGNKQLKRATERPSTAKYVFYASCGLSLFLIVWDLII